MPQVDVSASNCTCTITPADSAVTRISSTASAGDDIIPHLKNETNTQILLDRWIRRAAQTSSGVSVVPPDCEVTLRTSSMSSSITSPSENASEVSGDMTSVGSAQTLTKLFCSSLAMCALLM